MNRFRRSRWLLLALIAAVVIVAVALLLRDSRRGAAPAALTSPLSTPIAGSELGTPARSTSPVVLLWVVLGSLLTLGVAAIILRRSRRDS